MSTKRVSFLQSQEESCASEQIEENDSSSEQSPVVLRRQRDSRRASYVVRMIQNHYTLTEPIVLTPQELTRESWLFPAVSFPFNRWFCMPAAFIIQFCCGSLFTWIVFDKPIDKFIYGSASSFATPITFYIAVALIGISAVIMGPWLERKGPKMASVLGGTLFFFGNILMAVALQMKQMWLVYLGYGVSAGYGIGLCFISPVSALQKWFPDHRGLASGIAVFGFGAGSLANAKLEMLLIQAVDLPLTFAILGMAYFLCIITAGLILRNPPPGYTPHGQQQYSIKRLSTISEDLESAAVSTHQQKEWTLLEALGSTDFRLMYLMFFANLLFNVGFSPEWLPLITSVFGKSEEQVSYMLFAKGCFDLLGRVCFPLLSDYLGRKNTYFLMLTTQLLVLILFYFLAASNSYYLFAISMCTVAACYGGGFGTLSVFLVEKFGAVNVGPCFGVIITAWSLAGIFGRVSYQLIIGQTVISITSGTTSNLASLLPYNITVWVFLVTVAVGWISLFFVKPTAKDIKVYKILTEIFSKREKALKCCCNLN